MNTNTSIPTSETSSSSNNQPTTTAPQDLDQAPTITSSTSSSSQNNHNLGQDGQNEQNEQNGQPQQLSFDEIAERIAKGEPIPGVRQIPNKLNEEAPSKPAMTAVPKPWEKQ